MSEYQEAVEALAEIAYDAYGDAVGWTAVSGDPMPQWKDAGDRVRNAWIDSAEAVKDTVVQTEIWGFR